MSGAGASALSSIQRLFWDMIRSRHGAAGALRALGPDARRRFDETFAGDARLGAVERLDIYANMYFFRLVDALGEDFPKLRNALGEAHFQSLAADYLEVNPSERPSLRHLGARLPHFLASHRLSADFPWVADLARLEWARADLFDAPDALPLRREALASLPAERAGDATFRPIPALAVLRFDHDVVRLWRLLQEMEDGAARPAATGNAAPDRHSCPGGAHDAGASERLDPPARRRTAARVWRKDFVVYHAAIEEEEALSLEALLDGASLARLCQTLAAGRSLAKATERAGRLLQSWLEDGILAAVSLPDSE